MTWLCDLLLELIIPRESNVWYRIDRITQLGTVLRSQVQIEHGVDAIHAATPYDAIAIAATRNSLKHGQLFKAVYSQTHREQQQAIEICREKEREDKEFESFMGMEYKAKERR